MSYYEDDRPHVTPDYLKKMTQEQLQTHIKDLLSKYDKQLSKPQSLSQSA
jgi:hypothetical protein